jgi:nucleotide-binding universal stress UspA family protein
MPSPLFRSILCPVDFSDHSRQALRYAALLARRSRGRLTALFVEDPMLAAAAAVSYDEKTLLEKGRTELRRFVAGAVTAYGLRADGVTLQVAVGTPATEIERAARRLRADIIVMGAHGLSGASRMMLGSTTHRILRRSRLPVLAIPPIRARTPAPSRQWPGGALLAPVDLGRRARADAAAAALAAREFDARLVLFHVVEPLRALPWLALDMMRQNRERLRKAKARLDALKTAIDPAVETECRVAAGNPAGQIAAAAASGGVGLVVMTRRAGQGLFGPRQGSISYQVLSSAETPVLALPGSARKARTA